MLIKSVDRYTSLITLELYPEQLMLIKSAILTCQAHSSSTMLELTEQFNEYCPHIDDACMEQYTQSTIDSIIRSINHHTRHTGDKEHD